MISKPIVVEVKADHEMVVIHETNHTTMNDAIHDHMTGHTIVVDPMTHMIVETDAAMMMMMAWIWMMITI